MYIDLYYQDVISNWYKQEIQIQNNASNIFYKGVYIGMMNYEVKKDVEINENEIEKNVI